MFSMTLKDVEKKTHLPCVLILKDVVMKITHKRMYLNFCKVAVENEWNIII